MEKLTKNSEWILAGGILLLIFNYIYEPAQNCVSGIWVSESCPDKNLTFLSLALVLTGIVLTYRKKNKKDIKNEK